ncbi:MAG: bifunctional serine/threonine-protein kinase/ABC transporter substrate-binding protein [Candidatus Eremiobacteraeota bacterium]|nr:bifunctional serine/threonine-protein kinase/ABC transporter substrate-binding protein [Candidatus Eremiobacteraeota bacterium]
MLPNGTMLSGRYRILSNFAKGGMSNLYLCEDLRLPGKKWVIKELAAQYSDPREQVKAQEHFRREADLLARLEHKNLPKVNDFFHENNKSYFVMEFVEGRDLSRILTESPGPVPEKQVAEWGIQVATVLYFLHRQEPPVVFRDMKPSNVMLSANNTIKLIDFGIARHFSPAKKGDTMRIGSPGYAPPEQYSGQTDPRSDIFSLGVTLYQLLTKYDPASTQTPFKFPPVRNLNPSISPRMAEIIEKAIQIDPDRRYQNALDMKRDFQSFLGIESTSPAKFSAPLAGPGGTVPNLMPPALPQQGGVSQTVPASYPQMPPPPQQQAPPGMQQPQAQQGAMASAPQKKGSPPIGALKQAKKGRFKTIAVLLLIVALIATAGYFLLKENGARYWQMALASLERLTRGQGETVDYNSSFPEDQMVRKGIAWIDKGSFRKAFEALEAVRESNPDDGEVLLYLNNAYALASGSDRVTLALLISTNGCRAHEENRGTYRDLALAQWLINKRGGINGKKVVIMPKIHKKEDYRKESLIKECLENPDMLAMLSDTAFQEQKIFKNPGEAAPLPIIVFGDDQSFAPQLSGAVYSCTVPRGLDSQALGRLARDELKARKAAIVSAAKNSLFTKDAFFKELASAQTPIELTHSEGEDDVLTFSNLLVKGGPDLVVMALPTDSAKEREYFSSLMAQCASDKLSSPILMLPPTFARLDSMGLKSLPRGPLWSALPSDALEKNSLFSEYGRAFEAIYKGAPRGPFNAFDALMMVARSIEKNSFTRLQLRNSLDELFTAGSFKGASATMQFKDRRCCSTEWTGAQRPPDGKMVPGKSFQLP